VLEESIKYCLVKNPNITQQIIDTVAERRKSALVKKNANVITDIESIGNQTAMRSLFLT
jgi:hypothetical protein